MAGSNDPMYPTYSQPQHAPTTNDVGSSSTTFPSSLGDLTSTAEHYPYQNTQDGVNAWSNPYHGYPSGPSASSAFSLHTQITPSTSTSTGQLAPTAANTTATLDQQVDRTSEGHQNTPGTSSCGKRKVIDEPGSSRSTIKRRQVQSSGGGNRKQDAASDVWYHMYGIDPDGVAHRDKEWLSKPSEHLYPKLGCRHCSDYITRNGNGRTKDLRTHLKKKHFNEYNTATKSKQLKALDPSSDSRGLTEPKKDIRKATEDRPAGRFTKGEFQCLLQQWLAEDPQAFITIDHPEFRKMLLYGTQDRLSDEDLDISAGSFDKLVNDLQNSLGKISFTLDWWTVHGNEYYGPGFLAITAHWCAEGSTLGLAIRSALVAIEYMLPDEWWDDTFERVFERLSLSPKKIAEVTGTDWNSITLEGTLEGETANVRVRRSLLEIFYLEYGVDLKAEIKVEREGIQCEPYETSTNLHSIFDRCHTLLGELTLPHDDEDILPLSQELADIWSCKWTEALRLIQGLLRMRQGLTTSYEQNPTLEKYRLNDSDWSILVDMNAYLDIWRRFNIEVDVESCESASRLLGALKGLEGQLRFLKKQKPHMKPFIDAALSVIKDFVRYEFVNQPSIHMMALDPTIKLTFVLELNADDDSTSHHITKLKKELIDIMREKCQELRYWDRQPHDTEAENRCDIERELETYLVAGIVYNRKFDLLKFWETSQETYPHLYRVALDILARQVAHVSCKRIFSTSERTKALLDGRITLKQFETLERIKYSSGKTCPQDVVWKNLEYEDEVKGTLLGEEMLGRLIHACEEQSEDDEDDEDGDSD